MLKITLYSYPQAAAGVLPFTVKWLICRPDNFKIWPIENKLYTIGERS